MMIRMRAGLPYRPFGVIVAVGLSLCFVGGAQQSKDRQRSEEQEASKYYEKWLNQDVLYIITDEERAVFEKLSTFDEKDRFIEQFWFRRDSDPATAYNEFKEEHYRRITYANQYFGSGIPGWKTDRGRIYIMFGEPVEIEHHTGGGSYQRKPYEGGGRTATYPFEVWRYRYIAGVGEDLELEFVDRSWTGEYKLVMNSWEKDLLLHVDGEGELFNERIGLAKRALRPGLHPGNLNNLTYQKRIGMRLRDTPFERMREYYGLQRPPQIKQKELQQIVDTRISYTTLPFALGLNYVWIDPENALVPITVEVPNESLDYVKMGNVFRARVGLYGRVISINGALVTEFEDRIASEYPEARLPQGQKQKSLYQKALALQPGMYKLELVVKDLHSGDMGTISSGIHIPQFDESKMLASPLILARMMESLAAVPDTPQPFVIGDLKVVPNVTRQFKSADEVGVYCHVYNVALDSAAGTPQVTVEFTIANGAGEVLTQITDKTGHSIEYFSGQRLVLARKIKLAKLEKGTYKLTVKINDHITGRTTATESEFEVLGSVKK